MTTTTRLPAFIQFTGIGTPQVLAQTPTSPTSDSPRRASTPAARSTIARLPRPDLLFGIVGFMLGAAALLVMAQPPGNPPPPRGDTNLVAQAAAKSATDAAPRSRG